MIFNKYDFKSFANAVSRNIEEMFDFGNVFRTNISGDELVEIYLKSFPSGTNDIFREKEYHNDSTDKSFIRRIGNIVVIQNGKKRTIWDVIVDYPYNIVSEELSKAVKNAPIYSPFLISENCAGGKENYEIIGDVKHTWNHFYTPINRKFITNDVAEKVGRYQTNMAVFKRGLEELSYDSVTTVLDLINDNNLYKGEEYKAQIKLLKKQIETYSLLSTEEEKNLYLWSQSPNTIKNSSIGSLLEDITSNKEPIETSVAKYESKVSSGNYKRSKSIVTEKMVKEAFKKIEDLGLRDALDRRYAKISDVSINDVIWADRKSKKNFKDGDKLLETMLKIAKKPQVSIDKAEKISINDFVENVLTKTKEMEVLFKNSLSNNLMSIIAPVNENSRNLFKWKNDFSWSYNGNITDTDIAKKVKTAGGKINVPLRVSLAWHNLDDLDIRCQSPNGFIYFGNKMGILDVDMNVCSAVRGAVENLAFETPRDGHYVISVNNYTIRERNKDVGFIIEMENNGKLETFIYDKHVEDTVEVIKFDVKKGIVTNLKICNNDIKHNSVSSEIWNIETEKFVKVETFLLSPNYWHEEETGNKHWFFVLENCKNDEDAIGIYNEFLRPELYEHRKVFEILATKTKCEFSNEQLSGLGFSETQRASIIAKVKGDNFEKLYEINF